MNAPKGVKVASLVEDGFNREMLALFSRKPQPARHPA